jgi:rSAM/selenodomain-associated transferase 1
MVGPAAARIVAVLSRAPSAGGKSRLFSALRCPPDPALLSALLLDTLDGIGTGDWERVVAVEPPAACDEVRGLVPRGVRVIPQVPGPLGVRMRGLMRELLIGGGAGAAATAVALVGSDLPGLTSASLRDAFDALAHDPAQLVIGPAVDGGYYLIAATRVPDVFDGIAWSTPDVLAQTRAAARRANLTVHLLPPLRDVDTIEDARALPASARRTIDWFRSRRTM